MHRHPSPRTAGFSLVEAMIGVTILVIGLFSVFSAMNTSHQMNRFANERERAVAEIVRQIEAVQQLSTGAALDIYTNSASTGFTVNGLHPTGAAAVGQVRAETWYRSGTTWAEDAGGDKLFTDGVSPNPGLDRSSPVVRLTYVATWLSANGGPVSVTIPYLHVNR